MRIAFSSRKDRRAAAAGILVLVTALAICGATCDSNGEGAHSYQLAVSSASGGSVTTPGAGTYTYDAGTVVQVVATPDDGYKFLSWTGDTQAITGPNAASTTITMNGNYAIVANFRTESEPDPGDGGPITP